MPPGHGATGMAPPLVVPTHMGLPIVLPDHSREGTAAHRPGLRHMRQTVAGRATESHVGV